MVSQRVTRFGLTFYLLRSHKRQGSDSKAALKTEILSCRSQSRKCRRDGSCLLSHRPRHLFLQECRAFRRTSLLLTHVVPLGGHIFGCWCTHASASPCFSFLRHMRILTDLPACLASEKKGEKKKNVAPRKQTIFSGREILQVLFSYHRKFFFLSVISLH